MAGIQGCELGVYTIKDTKAESYIQPFTFRTDGEAIRAFDDSVNKPDSPIYAHCEDYTLYRVGTFDVLTGVVSPCDHKSLGNGVDFKRS